mgnify:CR=1 FL=1
MEHSLHLPLAQSAIDRDAIARDDADLFDRLWENPLTRVLAMHDGKVQLNSERQVLTLHEVSRVPSAQLRVYLGKTTEPQGAEPAGTPVVLAVLSKNSADQLEANTDAWHGLRATGAGLSARDAGIYAQALALANWHETHKHCPRCGTPTVVEQGGWSRRCFVDDKQVFPRTDPAVIVSVIDDEDRILLGSQGSWEENRWSVLAGFVEPGESLVAAVLREVAEESNIRVVSPEYLGSQAWPFPYSLMIGFTARVDSSMGVQTAVPDGSEIVRLRWFSRDDLLVAAPDIILPSKLTIARALIDRWFGGEIPGHG